MLLVPVSHAAVEQCHGKHGTISGGCSVCPLQPRGDDLCSTEVMEVWDLVSLCVCKALVMVHSMLPCFMEESGMLHSQNCNTLLGMVSRLLLRKLP